MKSPTKLASQVISSIGYKSVLIFCLSAFLHSCNTYSENDKNSFDTKIEQFIAKKNWKMEHSESGLFSEQILEGTGNESIQFGSEVSIAYTGKLFNGTTIDKMTAKKPLSSQLRGLIAGFQEGLLGQKSGAKIRLVIPPNLGYGDEELEKIPAHSILVFEIEVVGVK